MTRDQHIKLYRDTKTYLGDSVYVHFDGYHFLLETNNGFSDDPRNIIALEPEVINSFLEYREKAYKDAENFDDDKDIK